MKEFSRNWPSGSGEKEEIVKFTTKTIDKLWLEKPLKPTAQVN